MHSIRKVMVWVLVLAMPASAQMQNDAPPPMLGTPVLCITDVDGNCISAPTPGPVTVPGCTVGDRCTNGALTGTWTRDSGCCTTGANPRCVAPPITCSRGGGDLTSPTPASPTGCSIGDSCTGAGGRSGVWFAGRGNPCCGEEGGCCQVNSRGDPISCLMGPFNCRGAPPSPTPTPTPLPVSSCSAGDTCTGLSGRSGIWFSGRGSCCADGGGCCQVDSRGTPIACLRGPFSCRPAGGTPTPTPNPSLPECQVNDSCSSESAPGRSGKWVGLCNFEVCHYCCRDMSRPPPGPGGFSHAPRLECLPEPLRECRPSPTPPPPPPSDSSCTVGALCQSQATGGIGKMIAGQGCCSLEGGCMTPPYLCPPQPNLEPSGPPAGDPYADPVNSSQCLKGFVKASGKCVIDPQYHTCAKTTGASVMPSVSGGTDFESFLNPKIKCCMDEIDGSFTGGHHLKFDCIENVKNSSTFDQLWAGSDLDANGGAPYAVTLSSFASQPITGFYSFDSGGLRRCGEFSEFAALSPIQPFRVDGTHTVVQQSKVGDGGRQAVGEPIPIPTGLGFRNIRGKVIGQGKKIPETIQDMRRCPVLIRAAMVVSCKPGGAFNTKTYTDASASADKVRCVSGLGLQFHVQVRQIYEISGEPTMKTVDTVLSGGAQSTLSIEDILRGRRGN